MPSRFKGLSRHQTEHQQSHRDHRTDLIRAGSVYPSRIGSLASFYRFKHLP
jgi:hypothetical protein